MRSRADHRTDRRLARLARWLGIDRNPLRRGTDRVEAALRLVIILLVVVAVPAAAVAAGRWADHYALHRAQAERTVNHQVTAVLLSGCPGVRDPRPVHVRADRLGAGPLAAARDSRPGPARSSPWPERARAARCGPGSTRRARSPLRRSDHRVLVGDVWLAVIATCLVSWVLLLAAGVLVRRGLDRRRLRAWEAEWRASGPLGSGRRS